MKMFEIVNNHYVAFMWLQRAFTNTFFPDQYIFYFINVFTLKHLYEYQIIKIQQLFIANKYKQESK